MSDMGPADEFISERTANCPECGAQPNTFHDATCSHYISPEEVDRILNLQRPEPDQGTDQKSALYDLYTGFAAEGALVEQEARDHEKRLEALSRRNNRATHDDYLRCEECGEPIGCQHKRTCSRESWGGPEDNLPKMKITRETRAAMVKAITGDLPSCTVLSTFLDAFVKRYADMSDERHVDIQLGGFGTAWVGSVKMSEIRALKKRLDALS